MQDCESAVGRADLEGLSRCLADMPKAVNTRLLAIARANRVFLRVFPECLLQLAWPELRRIDKDRPGEASALVEVWANESPRIWLQTLREARHGRKRGFARDVCVSPEEDLLFVELYQGESSMWALPGLTRLWAKRGDPFSYHSRFRFSADGATLRVSAFDNAGCTDANDIEIAYDSRTGSETAWQDKYGREGELPEPVPSRSAFQLRRRPARESLGLDLVDASGAVVHLPIGVGCATATCRTGYIVTVDARFVSLCRLREGGRAGEGVGAR